MIQTEKQSWSIIIFCYNEVASVGKVARHCIEILEKMYVSQYEIVIVDDGSSDGSRQEIGLLTREYQQIKAIFHAKNKGIGHTLRTGYANVNYENVCAVPADGQFDIDELFNFGVIQPNTFVSFYRKENTTYTLARNVLSWFNKMLNKYINGFDLRDVNWVKIYKTSDIKNLDLKIESSLVESEICAKLILKGKTCKEVTSKYLPREAGQSKGASSKIIKQAVLDTFLLWRVLNKFKSAFPN